MISTAFSICSILFIIITACAYFSKKRIDLLENKVYSGLLVVNLVGLIIDIGGYLVFKNPNVSNEIKIIISRVYLGYFFTWTFLFASYMYIVSHDKKKINKANIKLFMTVFLITNYFIISILPIDFYYKNLVAYSYGIAVNYIYILSFVLIVGIFILLVKNYKYIRKDEFIPLILFLTFGTVVLAIQKVNPQMNLLILCHSLVSELMYFTIENPDVKMLNELIENRKIIERSSEEKSIFLFKMSQGIKEPSKNIEKEITRYEEGKNTKEKVDNIIQNIDRENGKINYLVNDVMGLTSFDGSKIKKVEGSYNIYSLLEDIKIRAKGYKKNDIDYTFTTVENIPKELIGDRVAIKQVLMSLIINAFNNTSKGYVHVDVNSITKYDVCRLVITIEDSGSGIEINKINEILNQEEELTNEEYLKLDKIDIDLPLSYKIIKSLGGTMYIRSEVGKGTSITITLDQYIIEDEDEKRSKRIEEYIKDKNSLGKILLVDDNEKEISKIKKYLNKKGYDVSLVMYGEEVIKRIKDKEKYDYIMIDDELETMSGISLLKKLNKEKDKSKKIVILDKDKLFISDHYIEDGFNDYIDRENLIKELDRLF